VTSYRVTQCRVQDCVRMRTYTHALHQHAHSASVGIHVRCNNTRIVHRCKLVMVFAHEEKQSPLQEVRKLRVASTREAGGAQ
jgi:hypothetical protein